MNSSHYMDKQIMDLSNSQNNNNKKDDFIDLVNPQVDHHISGGDSKKDDIVPSYEFHPIRPVGSSSPKSNNDSSNVGAVRDWNSADSKNNTDRSIRVNNFTYFSLFATYNLGGSKILNYCVQKSSNLFYFIIIFLLLTVALAPCLWWYCYKK